MSIFYQWVLNLSDKAKLPEKTKLPEKAKSSEKIKSPTPSESSEINDNRYVVQPIAANPLKIKLKTGLVSSGDDVIKKPLKLKIPKLNLTKLLKESNEMESIKKSKKHKKKKMREKSEPSEANAGDKPKIIKIREKSDPTDAKAGDKPKPQIILRIKSPSQINREMEANAGNNGYLVNSKEGSGSSSRDTTVDKNETSKKDTNEIRTDTSGNKSDTSGEKKTIGLVKISLLKKDTVEVKKGFRFSFQSTL